MVFGHYFSIDLEHADLDKISSMRNVANYYVELLIKLNMKNHKMLMDRYGDDSVYGITLIAMIDLSSISIHCVENDETNAKCYIDIFTCGEIDRSKCIAVTKLFFGTEETLIKTNYKIR